MYALWKYQGEADTRPNLYQSISIMGKSNIKCEAFRPDLPDRQILILQIQLKYFAPSVPASALSSASDFCRRHPRYRSQTILDISILFPLTSTTMVAIARIRLPVRSSVASSPSAPLLPLCARPISPSLRPSKNTRLAAQRPRTLTTSKPCKSHSGAFWKGQLGLPVP